MGSLGLYLGVFLAALGESSAFVGLLVPGVGIVVGAGVFAYTGRGSLVWVGSAAAFGSVLGFALSYHMGRVGGPHISRWSRRAATAIARAQAFFARFGAWSVFWGHFFGPVRALIPFAAGAAGLAPRRFWPPCVAGAVAWGFGLTATGVVLAGGWAAVEARLGRASLYLALLAVVFYLALRLATGTLLLGLRLLPSLADPLAHLLTRVEVRLIRGRLLRGRPLLGAWLQRRLTPDRATGLLLTAAAATCTALAWLLFDVVDAFWLREPLSGLDRNVFHLLEGLRAPTADRAFLLITYLGSAPVLAASVAGATAALAWLRMRFEALLLGTGFLLGEALTWGIKQGIGRPRPAPAWPLTVETSGALPSNHAFSTLVLYGFLAYLWARGSRSRTQQGRLLAALGTAIAAVGFSRLYLGVHWLSDVLAGYALGGIWLAALVTSAETRARFGRRRPGPTRRRTWGAASAALLVALATWGGVAAVNLPVDLNRAPAVAERGPAGGAVPAWQAEPVEDLTGNPLGRPEWLIRGTRAWIEGAASAGGWHATWDLDLATLLRGAGAALRGAVALRAPAYPRFWDGQPHQFALARATADGGRRLARLWRAPPAPEPPGGERWVVWEVQAAPPRQLLGIALAGREASLEEPAGGSLAETLTAAGGVAPEAVRRLPDTVLEDRPGRP